MNLSESVFNANLYRYVGEGRHAIGIDEHSVFSCKPTSIYYGYPSIPWSDIKAIAHNICKGKELKTMFLLSSPNGKRSLLKKCDVNKKIKVTYGDNPTILICGVLWKIELQSPGGVRRKHWPIRTLLNASADKFKMSEICSYYPLKTGVYRILLRNRTTVPKDEFGYRKGWIHKRDQSLLFTFYDGKVWNSIVLSDRLPKEEEVKPVVLFDLMLLKDTYTPPKHIAINGALVSWRWSNHHLYENTISLRAGNSPPRESKLIML